MNPITITLLTLVAWIIGAIIAFIFSSGGGGFYHPVRFFLFCPGSLPGRFYHQFPLLYLVDKES